MCAFRNVNICLVFLGFLCLLFSSSFSEEEKITAATSFPEIKKREDGKYSFGEIIIDRVDRKLEFQATSNQVNGLVEYGLVHETGKTHESLFRTKIRAQMLHASLLLLKLKPAKNFFDVVWSDQPRAHTFPESMVRATAFWDENGTQKSVPLENLVTNYRQNRAITPNSMIFTGSKFIQGTYMAENSGSMLAIYLDDLAVINCFDFDNDNDDVWLANETLMPPLEMNVTLLFLLPDLKD